MKKTCLCIMGLLLLGTLCVPVAAETGDQDSWSFYIGNRIVATSEVKLNDHRCSDSIFQKVYVPTSLDEVEVQFVVTGGPDTTLIITKDYINKLRGKHSGWEPILIAWGGPLTYDVDVGGLKPLLSSNRADILISEPLVRRGWYHHTVGEHLDYEELTFPPQVVRVS